CAFATHNALTVEQLLNWKQLQSTNKRIEFQRLHGMGAELYAEVRDVDDVECRVYAPVGGHRELLAYLVRRMLENGANSSFVQQVRRDDMNLQALLKDPVSAACEVQYSSNPSIVLPGRLFADARINSTGLDLSDSNTLQQLDDVIKQASTNSLTAAVITSARTTSTVATPVRNPANLSHIAGYVSPTNANDIDGIVRAAHSGHEPWSLTSVDQRATCLERAADQLQLEMQPLMTLLISEAGKTRIDAVNEVREAIDFCRYYATTAREIMTERKLPGPTGEANSLSLASRGVFACISPWNFPLAIFIGQITAALVTGNAVVAKPAPQTPLIAARVIQLLHEAGIPHDVLHLAPGDAQVGEALIAHPLIAGVVFTGSTATARRIAQTLLNDPTRPLVPLIAETGGINAMIVDSTALPEQVVNDVIISAFHSAGQRCSALRLLCLQEEIHETVLSMLQGAMDELRVGNPVDEDTDIGPVIDAEARDNLQKHADRMAREAKLLRKLPLGAECANGT
ncbi:MAG: proline dehydrogenase family protein, partial [Steroidobacter sp.]